MARPQNRKRQQADDLSLEQPPVKKIKSSKSRSAWNYSPEFYNNLSKVWLTRRALRELDRRNNIQPPRKPTPPVVYSTDLARFARHGGPELHHLRGVRLHCPVFKGRRLIIPGQCPEPKGVAHIMASSRSSHSSQGRQTMASGRPSAYSESRPTQSTKATTDFSKSRRSSAYDNDFEQHLVDHNIYPALHDFSDNRSAPKPGNLDEIRQTLARKRPSLSPSLFTDSAFEDFQRKDARIVSEGKVMSNILPIIVGNADIPNEENLRFTNLDSITEEVTVNPQPDFFDGARPEDLHKEVRSKLNKTIVPTKHTKAPVAPNFFIEAKAPSKGVDVALRQALHDGAYGARAMHSLQNYDQVEPVYDGNAYTYSSTYHAGQLKLYTHHVTAPTTQGGQPEYHMAQLNAYAMTGTLDTCVAGIGAFRNSRDDAEKHRNQFIKEANARARRSGQGHDPAGTAEVQQEGSSPDEFVDCEEFVESQDVHGELPHHNYATHQDNPEPALPQYVYDEDSPQDGSQESGPLRTESSFATSFTSSLTPTDTRSKRHRSSHSPPSSGRHSAEPDKSKGRAKKLPKRTVVDEREEMSQASRHVASVPLADSRFDASYAEGYEDDGYETPSASASTTARTL